MDQVRSTLGRLTQNDLIKAAISAGFFALVLTIGGQVLQEGFDVFAIEWLVMGKMLVNIYIVGFFTEVMRRLGTDEDGKLFGKIG